MSRNYDLLVDKINAYTQKFYLNKLLRGSLYAAATLLGSYLLLLVLIYFGDPPVGVKTFLFFFFIFLWLACLIWWIVRPALFCLKWAKTLSLEAAAERIGNQLFSVKDKLLNTLQLKALADQHPENQALILAGIDQKIAELQPIPFSSAIRFSDNRKYIRWVFLPLAIIMLIAFVAPAMLKEGTHSFIAYDREILPPAPFRFVLLNRSLRVTQGEDLTIRLRLSGNEFPNELYLEEGRNTYKMEKENKALFHYTLKNIQQEKAIRFFGGGFQSAVYLLRVDARPGLLNVSAELSFPAYLKRKKELIAHAGELLIPEGTRVQWTVLAENSRSLRFFLDSQSFSFPLRENRTQFSRVFKKSGFYRMTPENQGVLSSDLIHHRITVLADQYPEINVEQKMDSLSSKVRYFIGHIQDDYGFSSLYFHYTLREKGRVLANMRRPIPIKKEATENRFLYVWDLRDSVLKADQTLEYFFEVADNDGVNGPKSSRSALKTERLPSEQEMAAQLQKESDALKAKLSTTVKLAGNLEKEAKKLSEQLLDKKQLSYDDKKQIEQLLEKQRQMDEAVKAIKTQQEKNKRTLEESSRMNNELLEKQAQIQTLFEQLLDDKTRALLQKLQQLMEQNSKDMTREELSKMQLDNKTVKNELDRILELYKQLEFEQNLQNKMTRLQEMARQQNELARQSRGEPKDMGALKKQQENLRQDFKALDEELRALEQQNEALERPRPFEHPEKESRDIARNQQESQRQLEQNRGREAAEKQEAAAQQMQQLAEALQRQQAQQEAEALRVSAGELRHLLDQLLASSFAQEKILLDFRKMSTDDPDYVKRVQAQNAIKDNMKGLADSLFSLSRRVPQLESTVNTEIEKINFNIGKAIDLLGERRSAEAGRYQQMAMTAVNNLALLLNDALQQLQNSQKNGRGGKGGEQSLQQIQKMQEQLNQNMQKAREQLQQQGKPGVAPKGTMSETLARMARQQQLIREALQKINSEENKDEKGQMGDLNQVIKAMKETEADLVNKKIAQQTLDRQKDLLTRLLEADKAQKEQDETTRRESRSGQSFPPSYQKIREAFQKEQQRETEQLGLMPPRLQRYYKNKIAEYFKILNQGN